VRKRTNLSCVVVRVDTDTGLTGCGFTAITEEEVVACIVNEVAAPALIGLDPRRTEQLWDRLYWLLTPRGQSGYASHAIAALDGAMWDLKAQAAGEPLWRLLGGARDSVPVYATFGFGFLDRDALAEAAREWVAKGFTHLKMTVGQHALARRDEPRTLRSVITEDLRRIRAVRDAVGEAIDIGIDANCSLDALHATELAQGARALGVTLFEEPVTHNDIGALREVRTRSGIGLAAGQNEGLASRFADFLRERVLDVLQPNVCISGGFTQCLRIAGMAQAHNVAIGNGGTWPFHNMHLHGGLAHGGFVEYHHVAVLLSQQLFKHLPVPADGRIALPTTPGLGFAPDWEAIQRLAREPLSRGKGKA
jgi:L-alanine-DL-glutamate epimerase-like enolase superfamily enzyme